MKYYATITSCTGQVEVGGTKESLIADLIAMKRQGVLDGSEIVCVYGVDLETGNRVSAGVEGDEILKASGL